MTDVTITPTDNGPYMVEGPVKIVDADGTAYDLSGADDDLPLPLRRLPEQAVLRRNPRDAELPSRPPSRAHPRTARHRILTERRACSTNTGACSSTTTNLVSSAV
jgi:hypothetical protein